MNLTNPFSLKESIFPDKLIKYLGPMFDEFQHNYFHGYGSYLFIGEYFASVAYPLIANNIKSGKHNRELTFVSDDHKLLLQKYLETMGEEEQIHSGLLHEFLSKKIGINLPDKQQLYNGSVSQVESTSLLDILLFYHLGECNFWTGLYLMYRSSEDNEIKKLLHELLIDESRHFNNIYKVFKLTKDDVKINKYFFKSVVQNFRFFNLDFVRSTFRLSNTNNERNVTFTKLVYNHDWHKNFNKIFLKKSYKTYSLFYPDVTFENYYKDMNEYELDWLQIEN